MDPTESVTVEGPEAELKEVAYAYATISVEGESLTVTGECSIALYNDAGVPITGTHVTCQTDTVNVRVPLYPIETIPLTVTLKDGETLKGSQVRALISRQSVKVLGDQNTLAELTEISLGEIDLDSVRTDVPIQMDIKLPDNVRLDEGQPSTASVTITVADETDGIATRKVQSRSSPNDTSQEQTPYTVNVLTGSVEIELRGTESALDQVDTDGFSIGLTFDSDSLGAGRHTVKGVVAATSLPAGVTVVEDAEVEIEIGGQRLRRYGRGRRGGSRPVGCGLPRGKRGRRMSILVSNIRLPFDEPEALALAQARRLTGLDEAQAAVSRVSIDARRGRIFRRIDGAPGRARGRKGICRKAANALRAL